jgi:adenylate kinase
MRKIIASISALALALVAYSALPANASESSKHITVSGVGTSTVTPDAVRFFASVSVVASQRLRFAVRYVITELRQKILRLHHLRYIRSTTTHKIKAKSSLDIAPLNHLPL